jgi:hypothetical protein
LLTDLAKQLDDARQTYLELIKAGKKHEEIFKSNLPQIGDAVSTFRIQIESESPLRATTKTGGTRQTGKCTTEEAIIQALADGKSKSIGELIAKASEIKGIPVKRGSVNGSLMKLKKDSKAKNIGRGEWQKA